MSAFLTDLKTFFSVRYFNFKDLLKTVFLYWRKPKFALVDSTLLLSYFLKSPYRMAREYNDKEPYGETPLTTLDTILQHCPIEEGGVAYELGSGRGRACFWLALVKGYKTVGIEYIPAFVERASHIKKYFGVKNVEFRCADMLKVDLHDATWIYLFGSALPDQTVHSLCKKFEGLKPGTKIITISYPLTSYTPSKKFILNKTIDVDFSWGKTNCFIHTITK